MNNKLKLSNISIKKGWEIEKGEDYILLKRNNKEIEIKIDYGFNEKSGECEDNLVMFCCSEEELFMFGNLSGIDFVSEEMEEKSIFKGWENVNEMIDDIEDFMLRYK